MTPESGKLKDKLDAKESGDLHTETDISDDDEESGSPEPKKQKCATARYVDEKRKKLEKKLSTRQKESLMLETMREDVELKKKLLGHDTSKTSTADQALNKIEKSALNLSQAILTGFQQLSSLQPTGNQFAELRHPQPDHGYPFGHAAYHNNSNNFVMQQQFPGMGSPLSHVASASGQSSSPNSSVSWEEGSVEDQKQNVYQNWS